MLILRFYEHAKISDVAIYGFSENHDADCFNMAVGSWGQAIQISRIEEIQAALPKHDFDFNYPILWTWKNVAVAISGFCENHDFYCLNMAASFWGQAIQISRIEGIQAALLKHDFDVDSQILWT